MILVQTTLIKSQIEAIRGNIIMRIMAVLCSNSCPVEDICCYFGRTGAGELKEYFNPGN
jgi:hypothetical protein